MKQNRGAVAGMEVLLLAPAALFLVCLVVRELQPLPYQPALAAQAVVNLYASSTRMGLWLLLVALPLAVLLLGAATLAQDWRREPALRAATAAAAAAVRGQFARLVIAAATLGAAGVLAIVALHMAAN